MSGLAEVYEALRQDALERGMLELAIAYGWVVIRLNAEKIERLLAEARQ